MYGIKRGETILCRSDNGLKVFLPLIFVRLPVIIYSAHEADLFLQKLMIGTNDYTPVVCKFTEEELEQFTINKLKGISLDPKEYH